MSGGILIVWIAIAVFYIIAMWKIYEKAKKPGWAAIIPIYSTIVLLEIVGKPWWWFLLMLIPGLGVIWLIWTTNLLSKSFGKDEGFTVGLVLLGIIFYPILAFGSATYQGPAGDGGTAQPSGDTTDVLDAEN